MAFEIEVKGKTKEIKFNYRTLFKVNKKLGTKNENGESQNDGAGVLFVKVLEQDDDALVDIIKLLSGEKITENEAVTAIENYIAHLEMGEEQAYNQIFIDLKEEMVQSGFFIKKVKKYIENLEKVVEILSVKQDEESKMQVTQIKKTAEKMKKELSSLTVPE